MTELLRDALAADEAGTPAGADLAAVRRRARALRHRRLAFLASVTAVVAAVTVPAVLAGGRDPTVAAGLPADRMECPGRLAEGAVAARPVPFTADLLLICRYRDADDSLAGARLVADPILVAAVQQRLSDPSYAPPRCRTDVDEHQVAGFTGTGGRLAMVAPGPGWCGLVPYDSATPDAAPPAVSRPLGGISCPEAISATDRSRHGNDSPVDTMLLCRVRVTGEAQPLVHATVLSGAEAMHLAERIRAVAAVPALDGPTPGDPAPRCPTRRGSVVVLVMSLHDREPWATEVPDPCRPAGTLSAALLALTS
jgi:hypothetical protein